MATKRNTATTDTSLRITPPNNFRTSISTIGTTCHELLSQLDDIENQANGLSPDKLLYLIDVIEISSRQARSAIQTAIRYANRN